MAVDRLEFRKILKRIFQTDNLYFRPTSNVRMSYPAVIYDKGSPDVRKADGSLYFDMQPYSVTYICTDPDSTVWKEALKEPYCSFESHYVEGGFEYYKFRMY